MKKIILLIIAFLYFFSLKHSYSEIINEYSINGNSRISDETIIMFSNTNINDEINSNKINEILKNLYNTNFFENVSVKLDKNILIIDVIEAPIINEIFIEGIKAKKNLRAIRNNFKLKPRGSFNNYLLENEIKSIKLNLRNSGYYFAEVEAFVEKIENNLINIKYNIVLGEKAKIKKITFLGDKIYKDKKLKNVIISEEYKFWKFLSSRKFLNEEIIGIDKRLLKNFYLNKGYYSVEINTSFAKLINTNEFELIYNIEPKNKIYFNNLNIIFPDDFDKLNYDNLIKKFKELKGKPYSINSVEEVLEEIDSITINNEFKSVKASINENIVSNNLDIEFIIEESEKLFVERINIFGNNITRESVIRNQLEIDEGDPFSEILTKKSENNIKSLNFFKSVNTQIIDGKDKDSKIINISVDEKATGEISAGAGVGTSGGTIAAGIKENNYLGKGLAVEANLSLTSETFKGMFSIRNPKYKNSEKAVFANFQSLETDRLKTTGYKTNKTGFEIGTDFEYLKDIDLGISTRSFYEEIETNSTASARQKSQAGNYWDTFVKVNFIYDKRNQKYKTTDGFFSSYSLDVPLISDTNTLTNRYNYKIYKELYDENISTLSILLQSANSISGDDIKLSERLTVPYRRLRGFENGKIGPKDGNDFIGGNYISTINLSSTLPQIFPNLQNMDALIFFDAANIWGVDYDSSISGSNKIRSSIGIGLDWYTVIGPLTFSLSEVITKEDTDITESFRFNLGTTF